jgi:hypothetical protein
MEKVKFDQADSFFQVLFGSCVASTRTETMKHALELRNIPECRRSREESGCGRFVRPCQDLEYPWQEAGVPVE